MGQVILGDCLEVMKTIPSKSVNMILCDLPYGTTRNKWDSVISLIPLWWHYKRLIKDTGAIVLTACQPFTTTLVASNFDWFRYQWIWVKDYPTSVLNCNSQPLKLTEDVLVFSRGHAGAERRGIRLNYYPQGLVSVNKPKRNRPGMKGKVKHEASDIGTNNVLNSTKEYTQNFTNYPNNLLYFKRDAPSLHPTQKPVALFEYLIRTYTQEGDIVLDNCAGSGTTGVAALNTGRDYILIEKEQKYHNIINQRLGVMAA